MVGIKKMKKRHVLTVMAVSLISLTGCSGMNSYLEEKMLEKSGIIQDETYMDYKMQMEAGNADEEGYYVESEQQVENASIHVTFSKNNNLDIEYYTDAAYSNSVDGTSCYMNPGNTIYAKIAVSKDVYSSMYEFASFNICEYDMEGNRTVLSGWSHDISKSDDEWTVAVQIPTEFKGTELSLEPIGQYKLRKITLNDYYTDETDDVYPLDGTWMIDEEKCTNDTVDISAISSYIISYEYDNEEYFYASSKPECYYSNNEEGVVIFKQREATDETEDYSVELRKYITVALISGIDREVSINGENKQTLKANTELDISKLKYGDKVVIETDKQWPELETNRELILTKTISLSSGIYQYILIVPERDGQFMFDPSEYVYEHGSVIFKCFGSTVSDKQCLAKGSRIYYEAESADDGYWLPAGENCIVVTDEEETRKQLENIHFIEMVRVKVNLKQPEAGGEIIYYVDGKKVNTSDYETYSGTIVSMNFEPWEGWMCSCKDGVEYVVGDSNKQNITANGTDVSELFSEDESHKPELNVVLEKSVGEEIRFDFSASGLDTQSYTYESGWFRGDYKIIDGKKIGTGNPIIISMQNKAIQTGKAVKIVVTKTDSNKNTEISEIRYVDDLTELQDPIYIYKDSEIADSTTWYTSINIVVSIVDVTKFTEESVGNNAVITVYNADTMEEFKQDDLIEESQKVVVKILPQKGYYIVGGNSIDETEYQETMKYSKYVKEIGDLSEKHYAGKICSVKLDTSDSFAKYIYKYNGEPVSGTVKVKEGEELELEYEIVDSGYELSEGAGGVCGIGKSYKKVTKRITIIADMDGKTISKSDFGIEVKKGE